MPTKRSLRQVLCEALADDFEAEVQAGLDPDSEAIYQDAADVLRDLVDLWNAARTED